MFDRDSCLSECRLPSKCGALGVYYENQCVGYPTPQRLLAWDEKCEAPKLGSCNSTKIGNFKVVGVEHFMNWFSHEGEGSVPRVEECKDECDKDCGCLGYFYREDSSKCLLASVLGTLIKVPNPAHVAYIKMSNTPSPRFPFSLQLPLMSLGIRVRAVSHIFGQFFHRLPAATCGPFVGQHVLYVNSLLQFELDTLLRTANATNPLTAHVRTRKKHVAATRSTSAHVSQDQPPN
ncbi:hypothetical protein Syun_008835 [Stephania yunnanensis]|uniref:Apple domain-containing protein n=1 Tax=Stephania yunnanensis TaxID=152371 RepID=A0AAP0KDB9_9MAGN